MRAERAVTHYATGRLPVHFPNGEVCCRLCPLLTWRKNIRYECLMTGELLLYPDHTTGNFCPIQFDVKEEDIPCRSPAEN